jgi:hypothetical protein
MFLIFGYLPGMGDADYEIDTTPLGMGYFNQFAFQAPKFPAILT